MNKILKIIFTPALLIITWILYLMSFPSAIVRYHYLQNPEVNFHILGKLANIYWHLGMFLMILYLVFLLIYVWVFVKKKEVIKNQFVYYILGISSVAAFVIATYLLGLEIANYSNFLYSEYGITKESVYWLSNTSLLTSLIFAGFLYLRQKYEIGKKDSSTIKIISYFVLGILCWNSLISVAKVSDYLWYSRFSYDWVFENYESIKTLQKEVPQDGIVVIPPQDKDWPDISNGPIVRYFLFPRVIVSSQYPGLKQNEFDEVYFAILKKGDKTWPFIDEDKKTLKFYDVDIKFKDLTKIENTANEVVIKINF